MRSVHFEGWFAGGAPAPPDGGAPPEVEPALAGVADALGSLAAFVGAERLTLGRVSPAGLAGPLRRALATCPAAARADSTGRRP